MPALCGSATVIHLGEDVTFCQLVDDSVAVGMAGYIEVVCMGVSVIDAWEREQGFRQVGVIPARDRLTSRDVAVEPIDLG
jgi:hypothetical protein